MAPSTNGKSVVTSSFFELLLLFFPPSLSCFPLLCFDLIFLPVLDEKCGDGCCRWDLFCCEWCLRVDLGHFSFHLGLLRVKLVWVSVCCVPSVKGLEEMYTLQPTLCSKLQNSELQGSELQNFRTSSRATWVHSTAVRRATTIPARVIPITPASINVSRNKTRFDTNRVLFI